MKKWIIVSFISLSLLSFGFYQFNKLGGFNEVELQLVNVDDLELQGMLYRGTPQDEALIATFKQVEQVATDQNLPMHTIYYSEPAGKLDTMEVFVGIALGHSIDGFISKTFEADRAILAKISAHRLVMPGPNKVKRKINQYAESQGLAEPYLYIDKIIGPEEVQVFGLIRK